METSALDENKGKEAFYDLLKEIFRKIKKIDIAENQVNQGRKDGLQLN